MKNPKMQKLFQKIQKILPKIPKILPKNPKNPSKKILKIYHFFDRFFHSGGSSVPFGTIINSSRTNPRFGPSFK